MSPKKALGYGLGILSLAPPFLVAVIVLIELWPIVLGTGVLLGLAVLADYLIREEGN